MPKNRREIFADVCWLQLYMGYMERPFLPIEERREREESKESTGPEQNGSKEAEDKRPPVTRKVSVRYAHHHL